MKRAMDNHIDHINKEFEQFLELCQSQSNRVDVDVVKKAFSIAYEALGTKTWESNVPIIIHSIRVARIVVQEVGLGTESVVVALLHNVFESDEAGDAIISSIPTEFGNGVNELLMGLVKINSLDTVNVSVHSENFRKMMLAMSGDVRVILIKIADRLYDMRELDDLPEDLQNKYATESSYLHAPLAHRLGLYNLKSELEDLSLRYLRADDYKKLEKQLEDTSVERAKFVSEFVYPIEQNLRERGLKFSMKARTKSIFSIWNKMKKKHVKFDQVYDLFAIRVILDSDLENEKSDCWKAYSIVTEEYQPNPKRLRDWISIPKSNGYESLHTTVMGPHGRWVEIQIRTQRMDEVAEKGLAAHWKYKGGRGNQDLDDWLAGIREVLESNSTETPDFVEDFKRNLYEDEIFVFSPKGDLKKLPSGATMLDFAYEIHSKLGDSCVGGLVNGRKVTIKHKLQNGDQVQIDTSKTQTPKLAWLEFVVTSKAKHRIKSSINDAKKLEAQNGKEIILRKFKNWKLELTDENIRKAMLHFKLKAELDLFYKISTGEIEPLAMKNIFVQTEEEDSKAKDLISSLMPKKVVSDLKFESGDEFLVIDKDLKNVVYKLAQCCNPIFGDDIFGFVTIREGIKIHRSTCPNAAQMQERYPYRFIKAKWQGTQQVNSFQAIIHLSGADLPGIVGDISHIISKDVGVQMRSINVNSNNGSFDGTLRVYVNNVEHLDFLLHKLKNIEGIENVSRGVS